MIARDRDFKNRIVAGDDLAFEGLPKQLLLRPAN